MFFFFYQVYYLLHFIWVIFMRYFLFQCIRKNSLFNFALSHYFLCNWVVSASQRERSCQTLASSWWGSIFQSIQRFIKSYEFTIAKLQVPFKRCPREHSFVVFHCVPIQKFLNWKKAVMRPERRYSKFQSFLLRSLLSILVVFRCVTNVDLAPSDGGNTLWFWELNQGQWEAGEAS